LVDHADAECVSRYRNIDRQTDGCRRIRNPNGPLILRVRIRRARNAHELKPELLRFLGENAQNLGNLILLFPRHPHLLRKG
jgi:hypothetical protein